MTTEHKPHSERLREIRVYLAEDAAIDDMPRAHPSSPTPMLRDLLAAYDGFEEQLEAAQQRLAWAARLLRYPDGGDQFSIDCRNWLNDYYATSNPAHDLWTITGDGSGEKLPPIVEGSLAPRTSEGRNRPSTGDRVRGPSVDPPESSPASEPEQEAK